MQFFGKTNIDFLGKRKALVYLSLVLSVLGVLLPFVLQLKMGIDFTGGSEVAVQFSKTEETHTVRTALEQAGFRGIEIKMFGGERQYLIRVPAGSLKGKADEELATVLRTKFPDETITVSKADTIEPKVGAELRTQALIAVVLAILAIMIYIAFRFEFTYGIGAAIAIIHDVLVTLAIVTMVSKLDIVNLEMNTAMIAAFLTVVGFSVNDTVIIFDRIRENRERHKAMNIIKLINTSINETLSRTINTVTTVVLVLLTMTVFGGEGLQGFAFVMLVGIIIGTYSSIYVASSFVVWYIQNVKKQDIEGEYSRQMKIEAAKA